MRYSLTTNKRQHCKHAAIRRREKHIPSEISTELPEEFPPWVGDCTWQTISRLFRSQLPPPLPAMSASGLGSLLAIAGR